MRLIQDWMQNKLPQRLILVGVSVVFIGASLAALTSKAIGATPEERSPTPNKPASPQRSSTTQPTNQITTDFRDALAGRTIAGAVTSNTPSSVRLSMPSLWWISEQLAALDQFGNKFIQMWIAYPGQNGQPGRVDLLVDRQQWSLLAYVQRYEFVNKFSTVARSFGFNTRVYDSVDRLPIAAYVCDFSPTTARLLQSSTLQLSTTAIDSRTELANQLTCNLNISGSSGRRLVPLN